MIQGLDNPELDAIAGDDVLKLREEIELLQGASHVFDQCLPRRGIDARFLWSALNHEGTDELIDAFVDYAPAPLPSIEDANGRCERSPVFWIRFQDSGKYGSGTS